MSGPARPLAEADDPALDAGVLADGPLVEWHGWQAVRRHGGTAVLPWRGDHLAAGAAGITTVAHGGEVAAGSVDQALVRVQKGRDATWSDLTDAWHALAHGGRLLVTGGNDVGIATWGKRIAALLGQPAEVLANHSRARVVGFRRQAQSLVVPVGDLRVPLCPPAWERAHWPTGVRATAGATGAPPSIVVPPGVFSHGALDAGTVLLLTHLRDEAPAERVLDLGCGAGHLGLHALLRWPSAQAWLLDADARAIAAARDNLDALGVRDRGTVGWWDVQEPPPATGFDLVLCNPPCHAGTSNDHTTAVAMFRTAARTLVAGGRLLVVANRQLPYEADLRTVGAVDIPVQHGGFKILRLRPG